MNKDTLLKRMLKKDEDLSHSQLEAMFEFEECASLRWKVGNWNEKLWALESTLVICTLPKICSHERSQIERSMVFDDRGNRAKIITEHECREINLVINYRYMRSVQKHYSSLYDTRYEFNDRIEFTISSTSGEIPNDNEDGQSTLHL